MVMDWDLLIDEDALASLLPGAYRRFARPVKRALIVFLEGLDDRRQAQIQTHQAELGSDATLSERLGRLARDCPVLHKLGQTLARDARLAPELRRQLQPLESLPPAVPMPAIKRILHQELGPLERRRISLGQQALAEASVAVVVPFIDQGGPAPRHGVFKLLKPNIEERLGQELELLPRVGARLDECCHELQIPQLDYELAFDQVSEKLSWEVRLDKEQQHLEAARKFYFDNPDVLIPALLEHCTPRLTGMERVFGAKISNAASAERLSNRGVARQVIRALLSSPFFSPKDDVLFHGDPHAGNLMTAEDGRLAIFDWSLAGSLGAESREAMVQLMLAAVSFDRERMRAIVQQLALYGRLDSSALDRILDRKLRVNRFSESMRFTWIVGLLDDAVQEAGLRTSADLMLFRKALHTIEGLVSELSAGDVRLDDVLLIDFIRQFTAEWPQRVFHSLDSRTLPTRISNADLIRLMFTMPGAFTRRILGQLSDHLIPIQQICSKFGAPAAAASVP
jgi:ubiquinone biosynthesis protein